MEERWSDKVDVSRNTKRYKRTKSDKDPFEFFSNDLSLEILSFFEPQQLGSLALVCNRWSRMCKNDELWKRYCKDIKEHKESEEDWKKLYLKFYGRFRFSLHDRMKGKRVMLSENKTIATFTRSDDQFLSHSVGVFGDTPIPKNRPCYWEVKLIAYAGTGYIGIGRKDHVVNINSDMGTAGGVVYNPGTMHSLGSKWKNGKYMGNYGTEGNPGDIIGVLVDLSLGSLTFYHNGSST
eukprot:TRINITY_DN393_c0_g1_i3.p1 TRINITY_DN393_c0_g1~~TRINITY_DN393_c0_g1_i3.p1  ORF type:complete len:236 (+),score=61.73 TRINITY_DN393_c0_g1_i3:107-814(+)